MAIAESSRGLMAIFDMMGADDAVLRYHSFVKRSKFHVSPSTSCLSSICQCAKTAEIESVLRLRLFTAAPTPVGPCPPCTKILKPEIHMEKKARGSGALLLGINSFHDVRGDVGSS